MTFFTNTYYTTYKHTGTGAWVKLADADPTRRNVVFFAHADNADVASISFLSSSQDNGAISLQGGVMWEPKVCPANEIWVKAASAEILFMFIDGNDA